MALGNIGFGVEIETSVRPYRNQYWSSSTHHEYFARALKYEGNLDAVGSLTSNKHPSTYDKWWITGDASIVSSPGFIGMESVSPILNASYTWEPDIEKFWNTLRDKFEVERSLSCGTHIHIAPWRRNYTLEEAKTIAFACCYHERYVISCLPEERRDNEYCLRNTKVAYNMGNQYRAKTSRGLVHIATDINSLYTFEELVVYMQGTSEHRGRRVLWNFRNLAHGTKGTIEFRGGRHLRGSQRAIAWITFAQVFVLMALHEKIINFPYALAVPSNETEGEVTWFWNKLRNFARELGMRRNLPLHFKMMSEKMTQRYW